MEECLLKGVQVRKSAIGILVLVVLTLCGRSTAQDFSTTLKSADAAFAERDYSTARSLYERAIREGAQLDSDLPRARNLASSYLSATPSETSKAVQWLQTAVRLDPQADGMRLQLCRLMLNTGDTGGAVQNYRALVERHPQSSDYVLGLASALRQDGKSDAALKLLKDTVDKYPNLNVVRVEYARGLNFVREFSEARRQFQKVLDYDPNDLIAQVGMAKSMSYDGDQEGALVEYDRILRAHPGLYDAMIGKAFALLWSGHMEEARELLQKGLARHPDDREVRDALNSLPKGRSIAANIPEPAPYVPPAATPEPAVPNAPVETHQAVFGNAAMEPRTIAPPKSAKNHGKNTKTAGAPESVAVTPLSEAKVEANVPAASDGYLGTLYAAIAVMFVLLALAAVTLWNLQKARKAEQVAAEQARREEFVAGAVHVNGAAMIVAGNSRRLNDLLSKPKAQREPVVIEYTPKTPKPVLEEEPLMSAEMSSVMDSPKSAEAMKVDDSAVVPEVAGIYQTEASKVVEIAPQIVPVATEPIFEAHVVAPMTAVVKPAKAEMIGQEVLIVGGLPSVVQLQCRWLSSQTHDCRPLLVRDWTTAADRIAAAPPAVIVLNSGSDDRWTSMRMLAWIVEHHPELRHRVIAVTTADHFPANCKDLVLCEPIDAREWQQKLAIAMAASQSEMRVAIGEGMRMHSAGYSVRQ
jgi:tetratricopeptide (TPR) repeat protein